MAPWWEKIRGPGFGSGSEAGAGAPPEPQWKAERQPRRDGGSGEREGQTGSVRLVPTKHGSGMREPDRAAGLMRSALQNQKETGSASLKLAVYLGDSAAVGARSGTGLLVQCSGCGAQFAQVWLCVVALHILCES